MSYAGALMQREISTSIISAAIIVLAGAACAAPLPQPGVVVTMDVNYFGCQSIDDLAHVVNLDWVQNDQRSAFAFARQHCIELAMGDQFKVQGLSVVHGAVCLVPPGSNTCYWTNAQNLKGP